LILGAYTHRPIWLLEGGDKMELYGFDLKTISRLQGGSIAKSASYALRKNLLDTHEQEMHYYSHLKDILYSEILTPENAPEEFCDLQTLMAAAEQAENRYDARVGRVLRLSLPNNVELSTQDRITLARDFVREVFVTQGMCAILAIHEGKNVDPQKNNPHAHIILTDRPVDVNGFCSHKNREWNKVSQLRKWRRLWAEHQNRFFKEKGLNLEVSHESLEVQGIEREPTIPLGRAAMALERKGIQTVNGNKNRAIAARRREKEKEEAERIQQKKPGERKRDRGR